MWCSRATRVISSIWRRVSSGAQLRFLRLWLSLVLTIVTTSSSPASMASSSPRMLGMSAE